MDGFTETPGWEVSNQYAYAYCASYDNIQHPLAPTDGTVMPISPKSKVWMAAEYTFYEFMGRGDLWVRFDFSRQSKVYDSLYSAIRRAEDGVIPSGSYSNLQAGIEFYNNWNMTLSFWNLFDQRLINWMDDSYNDQAVALGDLRFRDRRAAVHGLAVWPGGGDLSRLAFPPRQGLHQVRGDDGRLFEIADGDFG